jgi:hypothetical protein
MFVILTRPEILPEKKIKTGAGQIDQLFLYFGGGRCLSRAALLG